MKAEGAASLWKGSLGQRLCLHSEEVVPRRKSLLQLMVSEIQSIQAWGRGRMEQLCGKQSLQNGAALLEAEPALAGFFLPFRLLRDAVSGPDLLCVGVCISPTSVASEHTGV